MSYDVLRSLYYGEGANADIVSAETRRALHVESGLDWLVPRLVAGGADLVISGNPGDGKSHLTRLLLEERALRGVEVELDLSARPTAAVLAAWADARARGRPFVLCANQGPLRQLTEALEQHAALRETGAELRGQLGRLCAPSGRALPSQPRAVYLLDLADRSLVDQDLIERAVRRVSTDRFLPALSRAEETSAGRNILMMSEREELPARLARLLVTAGRRAGGHFTFRQIWAALAYALTAGKQPSTLTQELYRGDVDLSTLPFANLTRRDTRRGRGALIEAVARFADPARVSAPTLDEELWVYGAPRAGRWLCAADLGLGEPPQRLWEAGEREGALARFDDLKRAVALAHEEGEALLSALERGASAALPSRYEDEDLTRVIFDGLRRLYLDPAQEARAPEWLRGTLPLWVNNTYKDDPIEARPHVAVSALSLSQLRLARPTRAPWLEGDGEPLGPRGEVAWLEHEPSGVSLRVDPELLAHLHAASVADGPLACPERVQRFLSLLAGQDERVISAAARRQERFAVLERPRGRLVTHGSVLKDSTGGASYGR